MPIPDYETMMLPILEFLGDGKEHPLNDVLEHIYKQFNVTEKEKKEPLPSGTDLLVRTERGGLGSTSNVLGLWSLSKEDFTE